ncbi:MAG: BamA/TamA family outer membrane protein [Xanthomonadales bacterium]|nr:BamA/TamA family outer membrane protein [Xanthomonadales bacterium]
MRLNRFLQLMGICLALFSALAHADKVEYAVSGVDEPMLSNVRNHVTAFRIGSGARLNSRLRRKLTDDALNATAAAMRPYGYFNPVVDIAITPKEEGTWLLTVNLEAGPPVLVQDLHLDLTGPGKELESLVSWYAGFPLTPGQVLNQQVWDKAKLDAIDLLEESGYLQAKFSSHTIRVDPVANTARLALIVDTGPRAVMGTVTFNQEIVNDDVLASLRRFRQGDPYHTFLLEKFRLDLWRSGFFEDIEVVERRELTANPPRVDFEVNFTPRKKNTYQGTIGYGTDTLARLQFFYGRHLLSSRGDNFDIRVGWQQKDNQLGLQANYRLPRKTENKQFWIASVGLQTENQEFKIAVDDDLENRLDVAKGTINDYWLRLGNTRVRNIRGGFEQLFETVFVQYLNEKRNFQPTDIVDPISPNTPLPVSFDDFLKDTSNSLAIGLDWDWPEIRGSGFQTVGHHERAWVFTSNEAWGSDLDFTQVYLSSRWNFLATDRLKILLRAEAGYSNATNIDVTVPTDGPDVNVAATDLPSLYRFKAGGNQSVRGYAFNSLDNNGLGSNNVFTASAEAEFHFHENWSVAAFVDVGNAFNDWSNTDLKLGTGFGIRWYSVIGALRLDVAQGWALEGDPWRIHLSIGTNLL